MNTPRYVLIYEQFKKMILEDKYEEHQKLPSKRKLGETLKVSPLTVEAAYLQLIAEGYVYAIEKKGYFVSKKVEQILSREFPKDKVIKPLIKKNYKYSFETNVVDTTLFPNATWAKLSREAISENHHEMLNHTPVQGLDLLRREISKYLALYRGIDVSENQIIIGSSSTSLISMIVEIIGRDAHYAIEKPGYARIEQLLLSNDVNLEHIGVDQEGISVNDLKKRSIQAVHVTPSHQFPTGVVMPISRRIELLNWAMEHDAYVIEDDYDSEFRFQGKPIPALFGLDQNDRVIYMNTFSKSLAPSFRMSYMVLPKHLMGCYEGISQYHGCTVPTFDQYVLYKFMNGGYFERHINRMRNHYREKLEWIRRYVQKFTWIDLHGDEAGLHFMMEVKTEKKSQELKILLEESGIQLSIIDHEILYQYPCLVIGYSGIAQDHLRSSFDALIQTIKP